MQSDPPPTGRDTPQSGTRAALSLGELRIPASVAAPRAARVAVEDWLPGSVDPDVLYDAQLLVAELVANSVRHSDAPAGAPIVLSAGSGNGRIWFQVADSGHTRSVERRPPLPGGGMGLNLVENVASQWGVAYGEGTTVWFELALPRG